ncbi:hypothetical protein MKW94_021568 [Papaver nudicaule]|uniref:Leucine-rich repeat-containing N-terminal plant-type domain-containing protein n=1 Tax=Papaver nudicaule TaxID=74823 RepID=A0AA41SM52_PAPNU|nr:hypothetical protein [Papaver nudicaule]
MRIQHPSPLCYSLFLLFLATATTLISPSLGALGKCNPSDYKALMNIKKALNNPYELTSWKPNTDCCDWYVAKCDRKTNRINELTLFQSSSVGKLSGQISPSIGDLPYLENIVFRNFNITGSIPQSITKLKHLRMLELSHLGLSGPVPNFLNQLTSLDYLDLSSNQLAFDLTKVKFPKSLTWLILSHNKIFGGIPEEMKALDLSHLDVSYNNLCGRIPYGGKMQSFEASSFSHNKCLCGPPMVACKKM